MIDSKGRDFGYFCANKGRNVALKKEKREPGSRTPNRVFYGIAGCQGKVCRQKLAEKFMEKTLELTPRRAKF
jgi:hypothetical protein